MSGRADADEGIVGRALELATRAHQGQSRADGAPYLAHPLRVCELLAGVGADQPTLAAALLHDAVEDSELGVGEVTERFGIEIGELVAALTEDEAIEAWPQRKNALRAEVAEAGPRAAAIYVADKLANVQDVRGLYREHGEDAIDLHKAPTLDLRVGAWRADLELARSIVPEHGLVAALAAELDGFEADRAGRRSRASAGSRV